MKILDIIKTSGGPRGVAAYVNLEGVESTYEVKVAYRMGGMNYFTYENEPRGYYLIVAPVKVEENSITFRAFSGYVALLEGANRFNRKKLLGFVTEYIPKKGDVEVTDYVAKLIEATVKKNAA